MTAEGHAQAVRRRVVYTGRVQGVCFRATVQDLACGYPVVGHVRNQRDGTVELQAEGPSEQVDAFLTAVGRHFQNNITHTQTDELPVRGDECGFDIRY